MTADANRLIEKMVDLGDGQAISLILIALLMLISKAKDLLDRGGLIAALFIGVLVSFLGHWTWLAVLMTFLIVGTVSTKWRSDEKERKSTGEVDVGVRGWKNVLANGGIASSVAIIDFFIGGHAWSYLVMCSCVSVATADTLASEIGRLDPRTRIITTLEAVPAGTNGGMSPTGTVAAFYGGLLIAMVSTVLGAVNGDPTPPVFMFTVVLGVGWMGCHMDSLLGAMLENRGYLGKHSVNFLSTISGAVMALTLAQRFL
ncbi:MAG: DUF92 domain-containing protein [Candidatus Thalassarchaeaceae archaeon]|nr:DUF92 domain-containing protein [Candidatus Thalassarchaeaceae archaeon]MDP7004126.1 DUF92 domain-containing protein [Candidatus Thalassarchaeaceae archaeon]